MSKQNQMNSVELLISTVDYHRKDPVFWIEANTDLQKYKQKHRRFPRYYSELQKLHDHLVATLEDVFVPVLPACPIPRYDKEGRRVVRQWWFNVGRNTIIQSDNNDNTDRVEYKLQRWLDRIVDHPRIQPSEGLREFVESEVGFRPLLKKGRQTKPATVPVSERDMEPAYIQQQAYLADILQSFQDLSRQIERTSSEHKMLSQSWVELGSSWITYGGRERNPCLFILYKGITKGCQQLSAIEKSQACSTTETLGDEVNYQIRNTEAAQATMQRRLGALSEYLTSRKQTEHSLRQVERLKSSGSIDRTRADGAIKDLEIARRTERDSLKRYEAIDHHIEQDMREQQPKLSRDMISCLREYARSQIFLEKQKLAIWESIQSSV
ncbi:hypothetical protein F4703DRAFT_1868874 [Phycomyces blakesleeanus]|uniref:PX domain-containing protein n=1 Tax=Phycomyces blakesleeanus (strain ATCC 8743b / DSM 1359 / FGSC 10004 / NBRC 33097 / NRRL 1555) TaxID=763407 RepID=A0A167KF00_PHYB8|nr:hypothetical protein PHYBLDRAFT_188909 [Phycomyces blakesleeanus NRRL 1555(-)]OAD67939.1 hypothetical protein PHYBLDRAFT_188909 [Phycomyces blakesleeanus NRRL 1555(-)]|eukprot:XP_018285979.1 hypothetical protein PHYBLDRAFT_188909 [Phycomyces blakesleeanus NRRL 1555(-)]